MPIAGELHARGVVTVCHRRMKNALSGVSLILFFVFSEPIPFGSRIADMPVHFTVHYFLPESAAELPMALLGIPALAFLVVAFLPVRRRKWNWVAFALLLPAAIFHALIWRSPEPLGGWYPWLLLLFPFAGMNLWVRSVDYFYAACVADGFWDMGAAIRGLRLGLPWVPEPYAPQVPPLLSVSLDVALVLLFALLWWRRVGGVTSEK
jgi:hypothetical protein